MSDFEDRLREALSSTAGAVDASPPRPVDAVLADASARRDRRRAIGGAGLGLVGLAVLTAMLLVSVGRVRPDVTVETPVARLAGDGSTTLPPRPPTTRPPTVARRAASPTTAPSPSTTTTTSPPGTTSTTDPRPLAQRVPAGTWVVGLDGTRLRRIGDAGRVAWSPDGTMLAIATDRIWILSAADGHAVATLESGPKGTAVGCLDWSSTGTIGWVSFDGRLRFARMEDHAATVDVAAKPVADNYLDGGCQWSPDGTRFATAGDGVAVYDPTGARVEVPSDPKAAMVIGPKWSPDGRTLAAVSFDRDGHKTGVALLSAAGDLAVVSTVDEVYRVVWPADGHELLARGLDKLLAIDPASHGVSVETTACCLRALTPLADGNWLSAGAGGETVRFVSRAWAPLGTLLTAASSSTSCDGAFVASLRVAPDGRALAVEVQADGGAATRCDKMRPF
jgi:hypothetical protein